jgi:rifampicin phosphotransferase
MGRYVMGLAEIDRTKLATVGGKAAQLGELTRIDGIRVPAGYCVTTDAFRRVVAGVPALDERLDLLSRLRPGDRDAIRVRSADVRASLEAMAIPDDLAAAIIRPLALLGEDAGYAVRSSATAEDLATASFAGQQDTYLNVVGPPAVLEHVSRCWASLFTERAVSYRLQHGVHHPKVAMAVVVQRMVVPEAAGVIFTADPVTGHRKVASIEATFGLGEPLASGLVNGDDYNVRDGAITKKTVATKKLAIVPSPGGGTEEQTIDPERQGQQALTDVQVLRLARLGRRLAAHFGAPQDIEWCLVDDEFHIVQSRPITTLFPIPQADDQAAHVYVSVGHQQMMTDPMKPLGLSLWRLTSPAPMREAGGRLFVDITPQLTSPTSRAAVLEALGRSDPLIGDALRTLVERGDIIPTLPDEGPGGPADGVPPTPIETDPAIVAELIERSQASLAALAHEIPTRSGPALLDFILADIGELRSLLFDPRSHQVIVAGTEATRWLNEQLHAWLGETNAADTLAQSAPNNVTSEMGLALLEVADAIRPHQEVVAFLEQVEDDGFLDVLPTLAGGPEAREAIQHYLDTYGMRCVGEIDITRPRWSERPSTLVPMILGNIRNFESGEAERRLDRGRRTAQEQERDLLDRLRALPDGETKADEAARMVARLRTFVGFREYPKYAMVSRYLTYKRALLTEAERLVDVRVLDHPEDIFYLTLPELRDALRTNVVDEHLIREREAAFRSFGALTPPRVLTSDGEVIAGAYGRDDVPAGALVGLPVSAGTVEGRARVVLDLAEADLEAGDILVTASTDPSWTPVLVAVEGLVTEVGGLMTHGAVIAREYGLPAVVGVERATQLIADGQQIRVHGTEGWVEVLGEPRRPGAEDPRDPWSG